MRVPGRDADRRKRLDQQGLLAARGRGPDHGDEDPPVQCHRGEEHIFPELVMKDSSEILRFGTDMVLRVEVRDDICENE